MLNSINRLISIKLDKLIKERKLRDSDILRKCGFTRPTLVKIKNEGNINIDTLAALANGLNVDITYFLTEDSEPTPKTTSTTPKCTSDPEVAELKSRLVSGLKEMVRLLED